MGGRQLVFKRCCCCWFLLLLAARLRNDQGRIEMCLSVRLLFVLVDDGKPNFFLFVTWSRESRAGHPSRSRATMLTV